MTSPIATQAGDLESVDEYFAQEGPLDDALNDAGIDEILGKSQRPRGANPKRFTAPIPDGGKLLEEPDWKKVYKAIDDTLKRHERLARNRNEEEIHLKRIVRGVPFSTLEKSEDRSVYKATLPDFVDDSVHPVPNKVADLKKKVISQMTADDFLPNPKPDGDTDKDRGAADVTKKFLRNDATASGTNDRMMLREVLGINMTGKSAFMWAWVDPTGGGWEPRQMKAHPQAEDPKRPMYGPKMVMTPAGVAEPLKDADGKALMIERTSSPMFRYVAEVETEEIDPETGEPVMEEQFTDDAASAARQWKPKIRRTTVYPNQMRTVPATATVADASQIIVLMWEPLGEAKKRLPILSELDQATLAKLCAWRPSKWWRMIVPEAFKTKMLDAEDRSNPSDDTVLFWYHAFNRIGADYVDGGEIAVSGMDGGYGLKRDTLREDIQLDNGTKAPVLMDPPIAQFICLQDTEGADPFGYGFVKDFEGGNAAYAQIWMGLFQAIDIALNRNVMIPGTSPITGAEWRRRDGTPLEILTAEDEPKYEQPPTPPDFIETMLDRIELVMNTEAQTNETSSGLDSKYSVSGVAKEVAIKQARTGLAQYWQNTVNGLTQWWKIKTQLAKARYTVPMQVKLSGIESAYKQPWWVGSDLFGVSEVALEPGSGTMMNPQEKIQLVTLMKEQGFIDEEQAGELARSTMTDDLGLPPNIHEERINRCIGTWAEGPPEGFFDLLKRNQAKTEQYQAAIQQAVAAIVSGSGVTVDEMGQQAPAIDEQTAMAQAQQEIPQPELEEVPTPFDPRPNDEDPAVALIQYRRMNRMTSTSEYTNHPKEWRDVFDQKYVAVRQAAGVVTVAEKQQQESAQAENQQYLEFVQIIDKKVRALVEKEISKVVAGGLGGEEDAAAVDDANADRDHQAEESDKEREHQSTEAEKDRAHKEEIHARDTMSKEAIAARREQSPAKPAAR